MTMVQGFQVQVSRQGFASFDKKTIRYVEIVVGYHEQVGLVI